MLNQISTTTDYGLQWLSWPAGIGLALLCLLSLYAIAALNAGRLAAAGLPVPRFPSLRGRIRTKLVIAATLPVLSLALVLSEYSSHERLNDLARMLDGQTGGVSRVIDYLIDGSVAGLNSAARELGHDEQLETLDINNQLVSQHRELDLFGKLLVVDRNGRIIATTVDIDGNPQSSRVSQDLVIEKHYYQQPALNGLPFVSKVLQDPVLSTDGTIAIGVPINRSDGSVLGVLVGALDLEQFRQLKARLTSDDSIGTIIADSDGNTVFASKPVDRMPIDDLSAATLLAARNHPNTQDVFKFEGTRADGGAERYLAANTTAANGWQIFLYRSLNDTEGGLAGEYFVAVNWLIIALLVSIILSRALSNAITKPLNELDTAVKNFRMSGEQTMIEPASDAPSEIASVFERLGEVGKRVRSSYGKLRKALHQGEKLRGELIYIVANREKELEQRSDELKIANEALEKAVREDELTGLANRRSLAEFLDRTWRTGMRDKTPLGILLIDIDHFKNYNEAYGQPCGDNCLKSVADAIGQVVGRGADLIARYGGEEFVVILGNTPLEGAMKVAENIRTTVEYLAMPHTNSRHSEIVTVSVGVTSTVPARGGRPDSHLAAADRALQKAKETGRNKVAYSTGTQTGLYQALCLPNGSTVRPA